MEDSKQRDKLPKDVPSKNPKFPNLYSGGVKGNRGGGNIKSEIRLLSMSVHKRLLKKLILKADGRAQSNKLSDADLLRLLDICGKYGIGSKTEIEIPNGHFASLVVQTAFEFIHPDQWDAFDAAIRSVLGDGDA